MSIIFEQATKYYGKAIGIKALDLVVKQGDFFGFVGPNGAGKTTAIKLMMNLLQPSSGSVYIDDVDTSRHFDKIKASVGFMPSDASLYGDLTVEALLRFNRNLYKTDAIARLKGVNHPKVFEEMMIKRENDLIDWLNIDTKKKFKALSLGNKKKIAFVLAVAHYPNVIILDEPTSGLDPLIQEVLMSTLRMLHKEGNTIFLSSHTLSEVENNCRTVGLIKSGQMLEVNTIEALKANSLKEITLTVAKRQFESIKKWAIDNEAVLYDQIKEYESTLKVVYHTKASVTQILKSLGELTLVDVSIDSPSLETLFMHYYL
ncbi:MAG: hypothetical protein BGO41_07915 [Clostridiales bacterium 38-18]|nr:MAG: hypothetical protein BGO41_07915 [Clostridiales bacterium 38-18]